MRIMEREVSDEAVSARTLSPCRVAAASSGISPVGGRAPYAPVPGSRRSSARREGRPRRRSRTRSAPAAGCPRRPTDSAGHDVPEGLLRPVVKIGSGHEYVAQPWGLERGGIGLLLRDEEATERRHVGLNRRTIDGGRITRVDELFGPARQRDDVVADDADADVVKVVVHEERGVPLFLRQRVALVVAATGVEEIPAALGGLVGVRVASDEVIEGGIERELRSLVRRDGAQQVGPLGGRPNTLRKRSS